MATANPLLLLERHGPVAVVRLNRPERGNAWSDELGAEYFDLLRELERDVLVRVIVVTGSGSTFCVGGDSDLLAEIAHAGELDPRANGRERHLTTSYVAKPVIAAINGGTAGVGLMQAMACDIRFAARSANFSTAFARLGLSAEAGIGWLLPRVAGMSNALDVLLSARKFSSEEACRMGMVSRVLDDDQLMPFVLDYAREMAENCSPSSLATIKEQVWLSLDQSSLDAQSYADLVASASASGPDFAEGVRSYLEGRRPHFTPWTPRS